MWLLAPKPSMVLVDDLQGVCCQLSRQNGPSVGSSTWACTKRM